MTDAPAPRPAPRAIAVVILAAGQGTRMKSDLHKVLHPVAGRPMVLHLLTSVEALAPARIVVVAGARREQVEAAVAGRATVAVQAEQRGTAHAVLAAKEALSGFDGDVLVLFGDAPLVETATMRRLLEVLNETASQRPADNTILEVNDRWSNTQYSFTAAADNLRDNSAASSSVPSQDFSTDIAVLGFRPADPAHYGRIIADNGVIQRMVEFKDASPAERAVDLCNSGVLAARAADLWPLLARVGNDNAAGEYYLPDIVALADRPARVIETDAAEVAGVNSRAELAAVEAAWQARTRAAMMAAGVSLLAPDTVWFAHDTVVGRDVTIEPNVVFGPGVTIADGATIHAFSHLTGATVGAGASVGPFARLRPGADLGAHAKVGNFVEIKAATLGPGAKVSHLTYLGDATVGANANIGAGTITCNYDGYFKYRTNIGADAFIGSNSALVAPVTIGDGAIVGAGSVVTADVAPGALALARGTQTAKPGWATRFAAAMRTKKAART